MEKLRREAESKDISLNSLVGQIFSLHVGWYANASKAGFVPIPKSFLVKVTEKLTQDEMKAIAEYIIRNEIKNLTLILGREQNIESILEGFEFWLKSANFIYKHDNDDGVHKFVIIHDAGKNWSIYLAEVMKSIFEQLNARSKFDVMPKILTFSVSKT